MSIIEMMLACTLAVLSIFPIVMLLYSLSPTYLEQLLGLAPEDEPVHAVFLNKHQQVDLYEKSKNIRSTYSLSDIDHSFADSCSFLYQDMNVFSNALDGNNIMNPYPTNLSTVFEQLQMSVSALPTGISSFGESLVMTINSSSTTDPDLIIVKKVSPDNQYEWQEVSHVDTGPGLVDLYIKGFTAFAANTSIKNQAQAIDISDVVHPRIINQYIFPGSNSSTTPIAKKVVPYKDILIVGTQKSSLPEIAIFDILTAKVLAHVDTEYGINYMYVDPHTDALYILGPSNPEIEVYDLHSLISAIENGTNTSTFDSYGTTLQKIGEYDAEGGSGNGKILERVGNTFIFGRTKGGEELSLLTAQQATSTASNRTVLFTKIIGQQISASIDALVGDIHKLIAFTSDTNKSVIMFSVPTHTEDNSPTSLKSTSSLTLPGRVSDVDCSHNALYILLKNSSYPLFIMSPS